MHAEAVCSIMRMYNIWEFAFQCLFFFFFFFFFFRSGYSMYVCQGESCILSEYGKYTQSDILIHKWANYTLLSSVYCFAM